MKWVCTRNYCSHINNKKMEEDNFSSGGSSFGSICMYFFVSKKIVMDGYIAFCELCRQKVPHCGGTMNLKNRI